MRVRAGIVVDDASNAKDGSVVGPLREFLNQ